MEQYLPAEEIKLVHSGHNYFEVLEQIIHESKFTLHLQTYIFLVDETGIRIIEAIKQAVARGVKVFVLVDAFGCYPSFQLIDALKESGASFRLFSRLFSSESIYFGRRLHHKIVVADSCVALTGGINIADKYNQVHGEQAWLDYAVIVRGKICEYLHLLCEQFYYKQSGKALKNWERKHKTLQPASSLIRYRRNDWIKRHDEIYKSYVHALVHAQNSVTIVASYFLPGSIFRKLLKNTADRGVKINIIMAGKLDSISLRLAEKYLYDFYFQNNIQLFEWRNSVMHGKAIVVDGEWASIGSYNVNYLSRYLSVELNADIIDPTFIEQFTNHLDEIRLNDCNFINEQQQFKETTVWNKPGRWLAYNFHRLLENFMMLGRKYRNKKNKTFN